MTAPSRWYAKSSTVGIPIISFDPAPRSTNSIARLRPLSGKSRAFGRKTMPHTPCQGFSHPLLSEKDFLRKLALLQGPNCTKHSWRVACSTSSLQFGNDDTPKKSRPRVLSRAGRVRQAVVKDIPVKRSPQQNLCRIRPTATTNPAPRPSGHNLNSRGSPEDWRPTFLAAGRLGGAFRYSVIS